MKKYLFGLAAIFALQTAGMAQCKPNLRVKIEPVNNLTSLAYTIEVKEIGNMDYTSSFALIVNKPFTADYRPFDNYLNDLEGVIVNNSEWEMYESSNFLIFVHSPLMAGESSKIGLISDIKSSNASIIFSGYVSNLDNELDKENNSNSLYCVIDQPGLPLEFPAFPNITSPNNTSTSSRKAERPEPVVLDEATIARIIKEAKVAKELKKENNTKVYYEQPSKKLYISGSKTIKSVSVFTIEGKLVEERAVNETTSKTELNLNYMVSGVYIAVTKYTDGTKESKRFMIQ